MIDLASLRDPNIQRHRNMKMELYRAITREGGKETENKRKGKCLELLYILRCS